MPLPTIAQPLVRSANAVALAFCLAGVALLVYLHHAAPAAPMADRYLTPAHSLADPFRLPGCTTTGQASAACDPTALFDAHTQLPHAKHLLNTVALYTAPVRSASPNTVHASSGPGLATPIVQGRHVRLTLDPAVQTLAQTTADCYTGDATACQRCTWCSVQGAGAMYEQARARAIGILVLNTKTGAIEAAASAYTPCYAQQQKALPPATGCPVLPNSLVPHPDRLGNQALEQTAKLGSSNKVLIAMALQKAGLSATETAALPDILTHSRTPELIDMVMCKEQKFDPACARKRLLHIADTFEFLWDGLGKPDILGDDQLPGLRAERFAARFMHQPSGRAVVSAATVLERGALQHCAQLRWKGCQGEQLVNIVAELFGTGDALASPVGIGQAWLQLAAATNGQLLVPSVHLVAAAQGTAGHQHSLQAHRSVALSKGQAQPIVQGLADVVTQGTALKACKAALATLPSGLVPCAARANTGLAASQPTLRIASKTGTPVFSADVGKTRSLTLPQWRARCSQQRSALAALPQRSTQRFALANEVGKCNMLPIKWFAFMLSPPGSASWDKVVVVLSERNWNQQTQHIDSPNDTGPNVSAEAGLAFANALYLPGERS